MKKKNQTISEVLGEFVRQKQIASGYNQNSAQKFWKERMGEMINRYTKTVKLKNKTVTIAITSSSLKQELTFSKVKILQLFQEEFGENIVKEVKFI